jgi:hypothetical protein
MKQKTLVIILVAVFLVMAALETIPVRVSAVQQPLEITYPDLPLVQAPTTVRTALPDYVKYIFTLAMVISGLVVLGVFVAAGLRYLTSAGNPGAVNESKSRMISAFLGAIIILSSYLILNAVNPQISMIQINDMSPAGGVTFTDADGTTFTTSASVPNLELVGIPTPVSVTFLSSEVEVTPCLAINDYSTNNCENIYPKITTSGSFPSAAKAAKLFWHTYGIYAFADAFFKGDLRIYNGRYATLGDFNDKISSVAPRNTMSPVMPQLVYETVLHKDEGFKGDCEFIFSPQDLNSAWDDEVSSITTFKYMLDPEGHLPPPSGGVNFYKNVDYQDVHGFYQDIGWTDFTLIDDEGIYSLKIEGDYLVAIAEKNATNANGGNTGRCEVFFSSDSNLNDNHIGQCTVVGGCNPTTGCFAIGSWCPICTVSCAKSFIVIPIVR